jgi:predicted transglutaminase-like cysteine proteinase
MARIQPVLYSKTAAPQHSDLSLAVVNHWMQDLRDIPYGFSPEWKLPQEVETAPAADCKGKAVALYERMHASGARNVRLVIGKRSWTSRKTHAWLEWNVGGENYLLDPTWNWSACRSERLGSRDYIPLYAYAGAKKYRAATAGTLFAKN